MALLPASEAAAELLFFIFVWLFNQWCLQADIDLVEAEMITNAEGLPELLRLLLERCTRS